MGTPVGCMQGMSAFPVLPAFLRAGGKGAAGHSCQAAAKGPGAQPARGLLCRPQHHHSTAALPGGQLFSSTPRLTIADLSSAAGHTSEHVGI